MTALGIFDRTIILKTVPISILRLLSHRQLTAVGITLMLCVLVSFQNGATFRITDKDLSYIYSNATEEPFLGGKCIYGGLTEQPVKINNGVFIGGFNGLLSYTNFYMSLKQYLVVKKGYSENSLSQFGNNPIRFDGLFKILSGIDPLLEGNHFRGGWKTKEFRRYNPNFIQWGIDNLIPDPSLEIGYRTTAQDYYDDVFKRFFRLIAESYLYLLNNGIDEKSKAYAYRIKKDPEFEAIAYLKSEYSEILNEYDDRLDCAMNAESAIGFWIRRYLNDEHELIWSGFDDIMWAYDRDWYEQAIQKDH